MPPRQDDCSWWSSMSSILATDYKHAARIAARDREYRGLFHTGSLESEAPLGRTNSEVTLEHSRHLRRPTILQEGDPGLK
jgi:hypothetical protein